MWGPCHEWSSIYTAGTHSRDSQRSHRHWRRDDYRPGTGFIFWHFTTHGSGDNAGLTGSANRHTCGMDILKAGLCGFKYRRFYMPGFFYWRSRGCKNSHKSVKYSPGKNLWGSTPSDFIEDDVCKITQMPL